MVSVGVANSEFQALLDTGAAVTAVSVRIWREYLIDIYPNLNMSSRGAHTRVDGCAPLSQVGITGVDFWY